VVGEQFCGGVSPLALRARARVRDRRPAVNKNWMALVALAWGVAAFAADGLEERVEKLERRSAELYHTPAERKRAGLMTKIAEQITLSGLVEVEARFQDREFRDGRADESSSDLALATVELGLEAAVTDHLTALVILDWEEEEDSSVQVDEATIDFSRAGWVARFGRQDVPFGVYPSHFITDPLTTELGETNETAAVLEYEHDLFAVGVFGFNGHAESRGDEDHINDWGAVLALTPAEFLEVGASFLSDLADSDAELVSDYGSRVPAGSAYAIVTWGPVELLGEVVAALKSFDADDLDEDEDGSGDRPVAWNAEAGWEVVDNVEVAARVEGSREFFEEPELQYGVGASWGPWPHVTLSVEYLRGEFDQGFGDGVDTRDLVTAQLAAEF
jgi:hypothetical protein